MNVSIPYSWIKEYIKTSAKAQDISRILSLHSFSVEKVNKVNGDEVFEIEVTPNRGDALSVLGVARELKAVLPKNGFKCEWICKEVKTPQLQDKDKLEVVIKDKTLVPRFCAVVLENVKVSKSPKVIEERLEKVGIRALGNVIDVTNYMMIDKGQPMHAFDYDKIKGHKMVVRESRPGEVLTTLDGVARKLPKGVIVIEDGDGKLIDLCGIMGGKNSEVDENTSKVLLFVQVYDPVRIRKASMSLGHRTDAALRFEKGIDYEGVLPSLWEASDMICELSGADISSNLIDIVNEKRSPKSVSVDYEKINRIAGIDIKQEVVDQTLSDLGFENRNGFVVVPSWRYDDVETTEDLAEEVIRLYGYYSLPGKLLTGEIPTTKKDGSFYWEDVVRLFLKYNGFFECYTYSATTKDNVSSNALKISNPLSEDLLYLKTSLLPQLLEVVEKNKGYSDAEKLFELASIYLPNGKDLPKQPLMLGLVTKGVGRVDLKGIVEALFDEMGIVNYPLFNINDYGSGKLGVEIIFEDLFKLSSKVKTYIPLTSFISIKEDLTFEIPEGITYQQVEKIILSSDKKINELKFKDIYKNALTFSIGYLDKDKQISSEDTQEIRKVIFKNLEKIGVKLK
ncbi:MAG: phenylalanine--tRNA ligase subunit beta [Patescibacteria group bacterium]